MKICCHTDLVLFNEKWPDCLPCLPSVGHLIQSETDHNGFKLSLRVAEIQWKKLDKLYYGESYLDYWRPYIKLEPAISYYSVDYFYDWYFSKIGWSRTCCKT